MANLKVFFNEAQSEGRRNGASLADAIPDTDARVSTEVFRTLKLDQFK